MINRVIVVAGGSPELWPDLSAYKDAGTVWIGVDRGAYNLLQQGIIPVLAIGDFDSLGATEFRLVEEKVANIYRAQSEKDETDTQLGVSKALELYPEAEIVMIGMTGGRLDHFLSNLWLPVEDRFQHALSKIKISDYQNSITYFLPGTYEIEKELDKTYLAFVCLTAVKGLYLFDAKYTLTNHSVMIPTSFASNEFIGNKTNFSFKTGLIAVIQSRD